VSARPIGKKNWVPRKTDLRQREHDQCLDEPLGERRHVRAAIAATSSCRIWLSERPRVPQISASPARPLIGPIAEEDDSALCWASVSSPLGDLSSGAEQATTKIVNT
jgi:hypothetical protein